jgi:hypothetical protein
VQWNRLPQTRWRGTTTTLGPAWKVKITLAVVVPLLLMILDLRLASRRPEFAFLAVPIGGLTLFGVQFLPHVWERGRFRLRGIEKRRDGEAA